MPCTIMDYDCLPTTPDPLGWDFLRSEPQVLYRQQSRLVRMLSGLARYSAVLGIALGCYLARPACSDSERIVDSPPSLSDAMASPTGTPLGDDRSGPSEATAPWYIGTGPPWSLRRIVETFQYIVVGRPVAVSGTYTRHVDSDYMSDPPLPGIPFTVYSVQVIESIWPAETAVGDSINVLRPAHFADGGSIEPGGQFDPGIKPDAEFEAGDTYLFFLGDGRGFGDPGLGTLVWFRISDDGYVMPNGYEFLPGVFAVSGVPFEDVQDTYYAADSRAALATLKGQSLEEAKEKILAAIDEGPLPFVCNAPVCTPTPSPTAAPEPSPTPVPPPSP